MKFIKKSVAFNSAIRIMVSIGDLHPLATDQENAKRRSKMTQFDAIGIAEGFLECDSEEQYLAAWQYLVDSGLAWNLQGWFGRTASELIDAGLINA